MFLPTTYRTYFVVGHFEVFFFFFFFQLAIDQSHRELVII